MPLRSEVLYNVRIKLQIRQTPNDTLFDLDVGKAVDNAAIRFSRDFPAEASQEYIGNSESTYPLPSGWDPVSRIDGIFFRPYAFPYDPQKYIIDQKLDETQREISNVLISATSLTLLEVSEAAYFGDGDVIAIYNNGEQAEQNWVAADGNATTGIVTLKNPIAAAYSGSPTLKKLPLIRFLSISPSSTDVFKINYTKTHVVTDDSLEANTVLTKHQDAFEHLAAALAAYEISAKYANHQIPSIDVDAVDYGSKSQQWREVAEAEMKLYEDHVGLNEEKRTEAASSMMNLNLSRNAPSYGVLYPTDRYGYYP